MPTRMGMAMVIRTMGADTMAVTGVAVGEATTIMIAAGAVADTEGASAVTSSMVVADTAGVAVDSTAAVVTAVDTANYGFPHPLLLREWPRPMGSG
jgi:hypothetical protein